MDSSDNSKGNNIKKNNKSSKNNTCNAAPKTTEKMPQKTFEHCFPNLISLYKKDEIQPNGKFAPVFAPPSPSAEEEYIERMIQRDKELNWG